MATTDSIKYLGVILDPQLSWNLHVNEIYKRVSSKLYFLRKLSSSLPNQNVSQLFKICIQPIFEYCCTVWGNGSANNHNKIQNLQNYAARIVTGNYDYVNYRGSDIVKSLNWQTFDQRKHYFNCVLMFKCIQGLAPSYLSNSVVMACETSDLNTRLVNSNDVSRPDVNIEKYRTAFSYTGALSYNELPENLKCITSLTRFKSSYKATMTNN